MNRRLMVVEPDPSSRALLDRVLTAAGYTVEDFESSLHARLVLDDDAFDLAVVDELAGGGMPLDEVRFLRAAYPRLPLVVMGTLLTAPVLLDLLRLGVSEALPKPFTPSELRDAVGRALVRSSPRRDDALDYAAALASARRDLAQGRPEAAARALARAWARVPLDAEVMAYEALRAELEGRDDDATRGYRATIALRREEDCDAPDPYEGLARLAAYGDARPVTSLGEAWRDAGARVVSDPTQPVLSVEDGPSADALVVVVMALSLASNGDGAVYFRQGRERAFALVTTDLRPERAGPLVARGGAGERVVRAVEAAGAGGDQVTTRAGGAT